ncbi:MAG: DUF4338 domain-containing protein [Desulfitobacteriaceae bacterium]|nr:DUF4338 domain-containing protein [Desulfitobacteriaceae bacterium]MDI6915222.1 DUF4338 domain-containing protein [Desulfitobacteriaceae bacterium]
MTIKERAEQVELPVEDLSWALMQDIIKALKLQGFVIDHSKTISLAEHSKDVYRHIQEQSRMDKIKQHNSSLQRNLRLVEKFCPNGKDIDPAKIRLELRVVRPDSLEEKIYRWWNQIWWSIPYERSYGRQLRFVLWDVEHNAPFGLIGLQSAPLKMQVRDDYVGISKETRDWWINMSLSAQRVGALPPYNQLLGGKMVALALGSRELRLEYEKKYSQAISLMHARRIPGHLLFITTTGAFGKASIYNRLTANGQKVGIYIGETRGSGTFHISEDLYQRMLSLLHDHGVDIARGYGHGPSRKRQLISKACQLLNLPNFHYHGIKRGVYIFPHVSNLYGVVREQEQPMWNDLSFDELLEFWRVRWALPRAERTEQWREFIAKDYLNQTKSLLEELSDDA